MRQLKNLFHPRAQTQHLPVSSQRLTPVTSQLSLPESTGVSLQKVEVSCQTSEVEFAPKTKNVPQSFSKKRPESSQPSVDVEVTRGSDLNGEDLSSENECDDDIESDIETTETSTNQQPLHKRKQSESKAETDEPIKKHSKIEESAPLPKLQQKTSCLQDVDTDAERRPVSNKITKLLSQNKIDLNVTVFRLSSISQSKQKVRVTPKILT